MSAQQLNTMSLFCLIVAAVAIILPEPGAAVGAREEEDYCNTVAVQSRVDFDEAAEMCRDSRGELVAFESEESEGSVFDRLLEDGSTGHFWIGLRLPQGRCSNLSLPLRGYEWTAIPGGSAYTISSSNWKEDIGLCSASCVSVSSNHKWTERPCSDKTDGFLCAKCPQRGLWRFVHKNPSALRTRRNDASQASDERSVTITSHNQHCSDGPCEHTCADVTGGYTCSCFDGYIPDSQDPHRCRLHLLCQAERCPITVDRVTGDRHCPHGFVASDDFCVDIDECGGNHCDHSCVNSFGSFTCDCRAGYVLKDEVKCVKEDERSVTITGHNQHCSDGPCEHTCADVTGGYTCSCFDGYIPDHQDPHRCRLHLLCQAERCPITVDRVTGDRHCPDGFVASDDFCVDIDECDGNHCDHSCVNSFGSFTCDCRAGYVLKDEVKCVKEESEASVAASISPRTVTSSSASAGSLVWLWVVIAVALIVILSVLVYWLIKRRRQSAHSLHQRHNSVGVQNISC